MSMRQEGCRLLREIVCNYNDCTIPAVAIVPYKQLIYTGNVGRPRMMINIKNIELLDLHGRKLFK